MKIRVDDAHSVSALLAAPPQPSACLVLAHGAGAGMTHAFMAAVAEGLLARGIATLRFQFPSMEAGSKRPDRPPLAQATVRAAVHAARARLPEVRLFAGGKSFGGRMTSQAQAEAPLPDVAGLVFLGFPLHPAGKPSADRAEHLARIGVPMLFSPGNARCPRRHDASAARDRGTGGSGEAGGVGARRPLLPCPGEVRSNGYGNPRRLARPCRRMDAGRGRSGWVTAASATRPAARAREEGAPRPATTSVSTSAPCPARSACRPAGHPASTPNCAGRSRRSVRSPRAPCWRNAG
jgi:predicted alpha/beta-hydrolase family hydrolase